MSALRAPAILLAVIVASELLGAPAARGDDAPPVADDEVEAAAAAAVAFPDQRFGPRYVIDDVVVRGNRKTETSIIVAEAAALGPGAGRRGRCVRSRASRRRASGCWRSATSSTRGCRSRAAPAAAASSWSVEVEERGTIVINELFPSTSAATAFWGGADVSETNFLGRGINLGGGFVASTTPVVPEREPGLGLRLRTTVAARSAAPTGSASRPSALYNDGSEFYRVRAPTTTPTRATSSPTRVRARGRHPRRRQGLPLAHPRSVSTCARRR